MEKYWKEVLEKLHKFDHLTLVRFIDIVLKMILSLKNDFKHH